LNGTIQTAGTQTYDDAVVLSGATTLIGTTATFDADRRRGELR